MKEKLSSERGQALVIIAFALIGLIAITGLAIDGGMALSDRRHAQNAADTAALAGAYAKIQDQATCTDSESACELAARAPMRVAALDRALSNGYNGNPVHNTVEVYTCDETALGASCPAAYAGDSDYVQVIISTNLDTFFARLIGVAQVHNRVESIALADDDDSGPLFDGAGIVSINPECEPSGSFVVGGTSDIVISGGGIFSNAGPCVAPTSSFACSSNAGSLTICNDWDEDTGTCTEIGAITTADGTFNLSYNCDENIVGDTLTDGDQIPYFSGVPVIEEPEECTLAGHVPTATYGAWDNPDTTGVIEAMPVTFLTPGYYGTFPPKKDAAGNQLQNTIVMQPGIYCVDTVLKLVDQNLWLWGDDITIFVRGGNGFNINGGKVQLRATHTGYYAGYLIIVEPVWDGAVTACTIEGNSMNDYEGAIFAPHCSITVNGTSDTPMGGIDSQIIGFDVKINGGAFLNVNYDADKNPTVIDPPKTGVAR